MTKKEKALIAMSGGVDSAVAAFLLKENYNLTGITMCLWDNEKKVPEEFDCQPDINAAEAKKTADLLEFPHLTVALGNSFYECVVRRFIDDYQSGKTPNPCVECNKKIKFGKLFDIAKQLEIPFLATGHYANIEKLSNGDYVLKKAADASKDQSYFLWSIKKELLPHILFPLGNYTKSAIREIAEDNNFSNAHRSDSQDICFIPDGDYISFLRKYGEPKFKKGNFVDLNGNIIGQHQGLERYTIGQRKGLGVAFGKPMFVAEKNVDKNTVTLCSDSELYRTELTANTLNFLVNDTLETKTRLSAKIRYRHSPATATVQRTDVDTLSVVFDEPQRAITSGQSLVLYDGDTVIGGGIIK